MDLNEANITEAEDISVSEVFALFPIVYIVGLLAMIVGLFKRQPKPEYAEHYKAIEPIKHSFWGNEK